jgi:hypothetical protein
MCLVVTACQIPRVCLTQVVESLVTSVTDSFELEYVLTVIKSLNRLEQRKLRESKRCCVSCGALITLLNHECKKSYCKNCDQNREIGHLCYMAPLKNKPLSSENVLYVFYDFETTQDTRYTQTATRHIPNLVCIQQYCARCETQPDADEDCVRCGKRKHSFWEDPAGDMVPYLCKPLPWADRVVAIAHNAKAFDVHFVLNRAVFLCWQPEFIMNGVKIMCMKVEHITLAYYYNFTFVLHWVSISFCFQYSGFNMTLCR